MSDRHDNSDNPDRAVPGVAVETRSDLSTLAAMFTADVYTRTSVAECVVVRVDEVFLTAVAHESLSPNEAAAVVCSYLQHLVASGDYTQQTVDKASQIITRLATHVAVRDGIDQWSPCGRKRS